MAKSNSTSSTLNQIHPAPGYLFIEPVAAQKQTASGIYLPESHDEKPQEGFVLGVGDNETTDSGAKRSCPAKKGDKVIYKKWGWNEVKVDDKEYLFVKFDDILAIIS